MKKYFSIILLFVFISTTILGCGNSEAVTSSDSTLMTESSGVTTTPTPTVALSNDNSNIVESNVQPTVEISPEVKEMTEDEAFEFGKEKVVAQFPGVPIDESYCFHETEDFGSYFSFGVYTEITSTDDDEPSFFRHICQLEVEKDGSEVRFADGNPISETNNMDWWEPIAIYSK